MKTTVVWPHFKVVWFSKDESTGNSERGRQKLRWEDCFKEWSGMDFASTARAAKDRIRWKGIVSQSSAVPQTFCEFMGEGTHCGCLLICHTYIFSSAY